MLIYEEVTTKATPDRVWQLLSDPSRHSQWNPRIVDTESSGPATLGFHYRVTYERSGSRNQYDAEVVEFSPPARFAARLVERVQGTGQYMDRSVIESYTLTPRGKGTHVRHEIRIQNSGINLLFRFVVWLIMRTGRPQGQPFLQKFKQLAEQE